MEVKNDIEDARVLSKALHLAKDSQVKIPVYDEDVERIKELMNYYKFTTKQTTQQKNHLESLESKNGDSFAIKELKKSIKASKVKEQDIIDQIQMIMRILSLLRSAGFLSISTLLMTPKEYNNSLIWGGSWCI